MPVRIFSFFTMDGKLDIIQVILPSLSLADCFLSLIIILVTLRPMSLPVETEFILRGLHCLTLYSTLPGQLIGSWGSYWFEEIGIPQFCGSLLTL